MEKVLSSLGPSFVKLSERSFVYGAQGNLLRRNIEAHWFQHCITMSRCNVFLASVESSPTCGYPVGFATIEDTRSTWNQTNKPLSQRLAKVVLLHDITDEKDLFYRKQRERKLWWRKLARNPSTFDLTEIKRLKNKDMIEIEARLPFGNLTVETLSFKQDDLTRIEHSTSLDWASVALLCDSYDGGVLHLHPRLSPYKATFRTAQDSEESEELSRLILHLNNLVRAKNLDTVLSSDEEYHTPYTVEVEALSLKTGMVQVRSRATTLAESVHVSNLADHLALRCR